LNLPYRLFVYREDAITFVLKTCLNINNGTNVVIFVKRLFLYFKIEFRMKKFAVLLIVAFVIAIAVSSCTKQACPAYSSAENDQTEQVG
jgi:hypothetical protein